MARLKRFLHAVFLAALRKLTPPSITKDELARENNWLKNRLELQAIQELEEEKRLKLEYLERVGELIEARQMAGSGPWRVNQSVLDETDRLIDVAASKFGEATGSIPLKETIPAGAVGATSDIELALQNVEWRREVNLSWLEFSRWGIQQIILISRLHYIKNPWIQRGINIVAAYIFGRGVEVMSDDDDANDVLKDFFHRNKVTLGQAALSDLQKRLMYDGQVFFVFFPDKIKTGNVMVRTIDATEITEVITDPNDADQPWFYHRQWSMKVFDPKTGSYSTTEVKEAYYSAVNWVPTQEQKAQDSIGTWPINWDNPVLMFKGGCGVSKWHFDTPKVYAALDWAKAGRKWLEACATVNLALAQFSMTLTTKGGQQALAGAKQQLSTTVGPSTPVWDQNPTAVNGSIFASGPGTTLSAFKTQGAGGDPEQVDEFRNMTACVLEIPPTFLGDMDTSNLATATSLDRPTELSMLEKQERWRECLLTIATYVINVNQGATDGKLRESKANMRVVETRRTHLPNGRWVYEAKAAQPQTSSDLELKVIFPGIREGDMPQIVGALVNAMTLGNKSGQVVGIDEKAGVGLLFEAVGFENSGELLDEMYPDPIKGKPGRAGYDPDRTKAPIAPPIPKPQPIPGGAPQAPGGNPTVPPPAPVPGVVTPPAPQAKPEVKEAAERLVHAVQTLEETRNGRHS